MGCQELSLGWPHASQASYPVYYLSDTYFLLVRLVFTAFKFDVAKMDFYKFQRMNFQVSFHALLTVVLCHSW